LLSVVLTGETEDHEKTTDLSQVTHKFLNITWLYISPQTRHELTTSVVISTHCIGNASPTIILLRPPSHGCKPYAKFK